MSVLVTGESAGEIWNWSLLGAEGLNLQKWHDTVRKFHCACIVILPLEPRTCVWRYCHVCPAAYVTDECGIRSPVDYTFIWSQVVRLTTWSSAEPPRFPHLLSMSSRMNEAPMPASRMMKTPATWCSSSLSGPVAATSVWHSLPLLVHQRSRKTFILLVSISCVAYKQDKNHKQG